MSQKILVTAALPYANGPVHLGHLLEHTQVDVFVRAHRMVGNDAVFLCADDTHGTPIEVNARKQGITPEELIARSYEEHVSAFRDFMIKHDHYGSTNSEENRKFAELFYERAKAAGQIFKKDIDQMFCEKDGRFLPDRFIKGICPKCKTPDQYGDSCEKCMTTYSPTDLVEPQCVLCGTRPVMKKSTSLFYDLPKQIDAVKAWLNVEGHVQKETRNFIDAWLNDLKPWDVSREGPYFGFKIPGEENKYFYVWMDAPIGYVSTTEQWCKKTGRSFDAYWGPDAKDTKVIHFIGKDIMYFHVLFWPAQLTSARLRLPDAVYVHGMLTADGVKLSKSRGTFINARTYLNHLPAECLRYYLCTKFSSSVDDIDLNFEDFLGKVNGDLVNNFSNLFSRAIPFVHSKLDGKIPTIQQISDEAARNTVLAFEKDMPRLMDLYLAREYGEVIRRVLDLTNYANKYIQDQKPWDQLKTDPKKAAETFSVALNAGKLIAVILNPVLPKWSDTVARDLKLHSGDALWEPLLSRDGKADLGGEGKTYGPFTRLFERMEKKQIDALIEATRLEAGVKAAEPPKTEPKKAEKKKEAPPPVEPPKEISMEDFGKLDLRVGLVKEAKLVDGADKLLQLTVCLLYTSPSPRD